MDNLEGYPDFLTTIESWRELTEQQRKVIYTHILDPELNKKQISEKLQISPANVYSALHCKKFDTISKELAKAAVKELRALAVKALKESLTSKIATVKLSAAIKVLTDAGVLKLEPEKDKDQEFKIAWKQDGSTGNSVLPASETGPGSFLSSKV